MRSPDRIRKAISEMSYQVASQKEELNRTTEKLHEHTKRLEVLLGLETELKRLIVLGQEIAAQQETTEKLRRSKEKLQAAVDQARKEGERLMERNNHLERQILFADEKLTRQRERIKEFHKNSQARIAELTAEYNQKDKERAVMEGHLVELENEQKQLHAEMKEYIAKNQAEIRKVLETYWNLRQRAGEFSTLRLPFADCRRLHGASIRCSRFLATDPSLACTLRFFIVRCCITARDAIVSLQLLLI